ncbi:MAG TPA: hypothetical protein VGW80_08110 [Solirubrobacterales bacterium]|jgi:hypothetical protein|nr:hypothetical protein [Solirubrobacterales bacterium]
MNRKWVLAVALALAAVSAGAAPAVAATLYAGGTEKYSVAFKAEGAKRYVMQFAGRTHCYYTEPEEAVGGGGFSAFPAPKLMRKGPRSYVAHEYGGGMYESSIAEIRAEFDGDGVTGKFSYDYSLESFHCDTGFVEKPFEATRYQPLGTPGTAPPERGERRVYYGKRGPIELFLRQPGEEVGGIRGTFAPRCPLGKGKAVPARHALFRRPAFAELEKGSFRRQVVHKGKARSGTRYEETISLSGRVQREAVTGSYLRVRTSKPSGQRCVTGPIPFRAMRYMPARG